MSRLGLPGNQPRAPRAQLPPGRALTAARGSAPRPPCGGRGGRSGEGIPPQRRLCGRRAGTRWAGAGTPRPTRFPGPGPANSPPLPLAPGAPPRAPRTPSPSHSQPRADHSAGLFPRCPRLFSAARTRPRTGCGGLRPLRPGGGRRLGLRPACPPGQGPGRGATPRRTRVPAG